jgi:hypothetical protein
MYVGATTFVRPLRWGLGALISAGVLALCLTGLADHFASRMLLFYAAVSLAYVALPFVRRGDIPLVAMWVVLAAELAPLARGQLISPLSVAADVAGVLMAALPIYIARARQVIQGDTQPRQRRHGEALA